MNSFGIIFLILCCQSWMANALIVSQSSVYRGITFSDSLTVNFGATVRFVDSQIEVRQPINIQQGAAFYSSYASSSRSFYFYEGIINNMGKFVVDGYKKQLSFSYTNSGGITNSGTMLFGIGSGDSLPLKYVTNYGSIYVVSPSDASSFLTPYGGFTMSPGASICLMNAAYKMQGYPAEVTGTGGCLALLGLARIEGGNGGIDVRVTVVMSQSSSIILFRGNVNPMTISNFGQGNTLGSYYTVDTISYDPSSGIVTIVNSVSVSFRFNIVYDMLQASFISLSFQHPICKHLMPFLIADWLRTAEWLAIVTQTLAHIIHLQNTLLR